MDPAEKTVLITGSTRGIGLAFAEHYIKAGWNVIATARAKSDMEKLKALEPFKIVIMDTSDEETILEVSRQLEGVAIDLLINNAGIGQHDGQVFTIKNSFMRQFEVNTVGPFLVTRTLLPNLQLAAKARGTAFVLQLSSYVGSIASLTSEIMALFKDALYGYACSKAALNMITRALAIELSLSNIVVAAVHPGFVDTDMTQGKATLQPEDSVAVMAVFIEKLKPESSGKFFNLDPQAPVAELPW